MTTYRTAIKKIENKELKNVYIIYGEEKYLQENLINNLRATFLGTESEYGYERLDGVENSFSEIITRIDEPCLFSEKRLLVIDNSPYLLPGRKKNEQKETVDGANGNTSADSRQDIAALKKFIENGCKISQLPEKIVIFTSPGIDRRTKYFKMIDEHGDTIDCKPLFRDELAGWIRQQVKNKGKQIDDSALGRLLESGNTGLFFLEKEIEKYCLYLEEDENIISAEVVEHLFSGDTHSSIFKLCDITAEGNLSGALQVVEYLLSINEKPLIMLYMLTRHYRLLLSAKCLLQEGETQFALTKKLGVPGFVAGKLVTQSSGYTAFMLEDILNHFQKTDWQIKRGIVEPIKALEFLISQICSMQKQAMLS